MQLLLGRCPRCNHEVETVHGQFYCMRCRWFPLDPAKTSPVRYQREEFPDSAFWTAQRIHTFLHLNNRADGK